MAFYDHYSGCSCHSLRNEAQCDCGLKARYEGGQWSAAKQTRIVLKQLEDSIHAHNGSFTLRPPVEFNRIAPNPIAAELAEERAQMLADMLAVTGIDTIADWTQSGIVFNRLKPIDWFHAMDRVSRERALHVQWDERKLATKKRKEAENHVTGHVEVTPKEFRQFLLDLKAPALSRAFALSAPAESERQEYLAPYRMRG